MAAADEFKDKTTYVHQQWQTDFTYFKIIGWGWYYLSTVWMIIPDTSSLGSYARTWNQMMQNEVLI